MKLSEEMLSNINGDEWSKSSKGDTEHHAGEVVNITFAEPNANSMRMDQFYYPDGINKFWAAFHKVHIRLRRLRKKILIIPLKE